MPTSRLDPKTKDYGLVKKIYDFRKGAYTARPQEDIPENAGVYVKNCAWDEKRCLTKTWGDNELIAISSNDYNRFITNPVYTLYPFVSTDGTNRLIIQGVDASDSKMSLYYLDQQSSYPASLSAAPTRILGEGDELQLKRRCTYATYKGRLYVWNGADYLRYWTGSGTDWKSYHTTYGERFQYITTYGRRLWAACSGANPSRVIYTNLNHCNFQHYYANGTNQIDFNSPADYSPIMWITQFKNRLLVFKVNSLFAFYGDPDTHGVSFDIISHGIGTISGWSVQVWKDKVYFAWRDGIYVYGDTSVIASGEDRQLSASPNVIRITSEIDDFWEDNFTLPEPYAVGEKTYSGYSDLCSTLSFVSGSDASNFKADGVGLQVNDRIKGGTSNAEAKIVYVDKTSGVWGDGDAAGTLYLSEAYSYLAFDDGGIASISPGDKITGVTSAATAWVHDVRVTSGTWAGGDAAGYLLVQRVDGTFEDNENLNIVAQDDVATVDGTLGTWTDGEDINIGSKKFAEAGASSAFSQKWILYQMQMNTPPVSVNPDVINMDMATYLVENTLEQSQTTQDTLQSLRSEDGSDEYYSQSFKLSDSAVDYAICSGVKLFLKEIGDVSGDALKVYICGETDSEPDFDKLYAEGKLTGNFLNDIEELNFDSGSEEPQIGDQIDENGGDASGIVHKVVVTSGSWDDGDAAGVIYIKSKSGTWDDDGQIDINGGTAGVATVNDTDSASINSGCWVWCDMNYYDKPQNMYNGSLTNPPTLYVAVKVTGDDDANYLQWGYNSAGGYSDGRMLNSDSQTPSGQADLDYCFELYCSVFPYSQYMTIESNTVDGGDSHQDWRSIFCTLDDSVLGDYTKRYYKLEKVEYETKAVDDNWDWDNASETTNGGKIGDGTNLSSNRYLRVRFTFTRWTGSDSSKMDSCTITNIRATYSTQTIAEHLVDSAIWKDNYIFSVYDITDPDEVPS